MKAKFHFASEALDSKTTVVKVKTIQLIDQPEIFQFPPELQTSTNHSLLFEHPVTKGVVKSLKLRNKFRNVVITLTDGELRNTYLDEEGNVVFNEYYLEVVRTNKLPSAPSTENPSQEKSLHSVSKNMVLDKFNGKNFNAESWLELFKTECERLDIQERRFAEILRLCLEGTALEWYSIFLKINSLSHPWEFWNNSFIDTFSEKSWSEIAYAYNFKYLSGSLLDFALKKRNRLIDIDPKLTIESQINLIVIALPHFVIPRLEKKKIVKMEDLMSTLRQMEPLVNKFNIPYSNTRGGENHKPTNISDKQKKQNAHDPCAYCDSRGFPNRLHAEKLCRLKMGNQTGNYRNDKIKIANNIEIQDEISLAEEAKNE